MGIFNTLRQEWKQFSVYERFEQIIARILLLIICMIIVCALTLSIGELAQTLRSGTDFLDTEALRETFGSFMTVLILLEFAHSIALSLRQRTGVVQVRVIVLIAILVIIRKLILMDYKSLTLDMFLGFGGLCLSLGILYWLLADGDRRRSAE